MKAFKDNIGRWVLRVSGFIWISLTVAGASTSPPIELSNLSHQATQDSWEWQLPNGAKIKARVCQDPGIHNQKGYALFDLQTGSDAKVEVDYGLTSQLGQVATGETSPQQVHEIKLEDLAPRATRYYVRFHIEEKGAYWTSPLLSFKTLLRYPYGYSFSPDDPELRWRPGVPRIITGFIAPGAPEVLQRVKDVDAESYLQHIILTITEPRMSQLAKVKAILTFVDTAVQHNPIYLYVGPEMQNRIPQNPPGEPEGFTMKPGCEIDAVTILELHYTHCGSINSITAALTRKVGVDAGNWVPPIHHHMSGRVLIDGIWYFADQDAFKKGAFPLMLDGTLPPMDWILKGDNVYLIDTKPGWVDWSAPWVLTTDGFRITGDVAGGYDRSEDGYASYTFGGRREFPPSIPHPLPVTHFTAESALLEWEGSYDRDKDFRDYVVGVGTGPGRSDVGCYHTDQAYYEVKLPRPGAYYWRVMATDHHADGTPFAGRIYYENSEESSFNTAQPSHDLQDPPSASVNPPPDVVFSLNLKDGSIGGLEPEGNEPDPMGGGLIGWTDLFNIAWGKEGHVLELVDPSNRWRTGKIVTRSWHEAVGGRIPPAESWELTATVRTGRSYVAGTSSFPLIYVTDRANPTQAVGLSLNPVAGTVSSAVRESACWTSLEAYDPQNKWHTYSVRFDAKKTVDLDTEGIGSHSNVVSFIVDGKNLAEGTSIEQAIVPGEIWVSGNPEAEVTAWISKIEVARLR